MSAPPFSINTQDYLPHNLIATPTNLKDTYLNSERKFISSLLLLTSSIMEPHNLTLVFKRGFGNAFPSIHYTGWLNVLHKVYRLESSSQLVQKE
jgi:hypothetical protein